MLSILSLKIIRIRNPRFCQIYQLLFITDNVSTRYCFGEYYFMLSRRSGLANLDFAKVLMANMSYSKILKAYASNSNYLMRQTGRHRIYTSVFGPKF
jgi:hypothetical protein